MSSSSRPSLATRIRDAELARLRELFPHCEEAHVEDVYNANGGKFLPTQQQLSRESGGAADEVPEAGATTTPGTSIRTASTESDNERDAAVDAEVAAVAAAVAPQPVGSPTSSGRKRPAPASTGVDAMPSEKRQSTAATAPPRAGLKPPARSSRFPAGIFSATQSWLLVPLIWKALGDDEVAEMWAYSAIEEEAGRRRVPLQQLVQVLRARVAQAGLTPVEAGMQSPRGALEAAAHALGAANTTRYISAEQQERLLLGWTSMRTDEERYAVLDTDAELALPVAHFAESLQRVPPVPQFGAGGHPTLVMASGDLFALPTLNLAHCVSADGALGGAVARRVCELVGKSVLRDAIRECGEVGAAAPVSTGQRFVYNLITKERSNERPSLDNVRKALRSMREHCVAHKCTHVVMPRIGTGADKLPWEEVRKLVEQEFRAEHGVLVVVKTGK